MSVDPYEVGLTVVGVAALLAAWIPAYSSTRPVSVPMVLVVLGAVVFAFPLGLPSPDPRRWLEGTERLTELVVIVSLMGAGLRIDRPFRWTTWTSTWRMVVVAMPLSIVGIAIAGRAAGFGLASAVLLGAVLAPTDPVLASDVQVGEPTLDDEPAPTAEEEVRFTLTSEGGLNDALAFPFVYLALVLRGPWSTSELATWVAWDLVGRTVIGAVVGIVVGRVLGTIAFRPPGRLTSLADTPQGFVVIAATLISYGGAELLSGYGFLAVFVAAVTVRTAERGSELHAQLHGFADQTENLMVAGLLLLLGGALVSGVLEHATWSTVVLSLTAIIVVRPISGALALLGSRLSFAERAVVSFFGIRGFGSIYYLAYALTAASFHEADRLWSVVAVTILMSVVVHGALATPAMRKIDRLAGRGRRSTGGGPVRSTG